MLERMGAHKTAAEADAGTSFRRELVHRAGVTPRVLVDATGQPAIQIVPSGIETPTKETKGAPPWHWYFSRRIVAWEL